MNGPNPYVPSTAGGASGQDELRPRSPLKRVIIGALLAGSLPLLLGVYGLSQFWAYTTSLPPGTAACGNGALGPLFLIVVVAPILAAIGGASAVTVK